MKNHTEMDILGKSYFWNGLNVKGSQIKLIYDYR